MTRTKQRRLARILGAAAAVLVILTGCLLLRPAPRAEISAAPAEFAPLSESARLDLNLATAEELACLPGIGPVTAEAILARRAELGAFRSREDVLSVSGLGEATYASIAPYITY